MDVTSTFNQQQIYRAATHCIFGVNIVAKEMAIHLVDPAVKSIGTK